MRFFSLFPKRLQWILQMLLVLLILMTAYRLMFYYHYRPVNKPFSGKTFLLGLRFDARLISITGILILILSSIPFLNPFKKRAALYFWNALITVLFFIILMMYAVDFFHYDYLQQRLNASVLNFLEDSAISSKMVWETYPVLKMAFGITLTLGLILFMHNRFLKQKISAHSMMNPGKPRLYFAVIFLFFALFTFGKLDQYPLRWSDAFTLADDFKAQAALNPFQSFFSSLQFKNSGYDIKKLRSGYALMADYLGVDNKDSIELNFERKITFTDTLLKKPNVILVICESFSAYKSSMFGNKLDPTPFFNSLCKQGVFFERCFTPAFGTARGVWATITGIPDVESPKTASRNPAAVDQHTIINDLHAHDKFYFLGGSTTWANIRGLLNNNISGLKIYEEENFKAGKVDVWGISDKNLFLESTKILAQQQKPFFAIIQTADNHRPYTIPQEDEAEFKKVNYPADTLKKYGFEDNEQLNAFRYTDFCFQKFMEAARKQSFFNNTIFVFVGDHGLRGDAGKMFPAAFTKQGILAEHVPLLFYAPAMLQPVSVRNVCSQLDIMPSVAGLLKQRYRNNTFGRDLFDTSDQKERYAFIADPDMHTIGLVSNNFYYARNIRTNKKDFVSVTWDTVPVGIAADSAKAKMSSLTEAWYETSKYLLLHNKKQP